jgi:hypothetical protein
MYKWCSPGAVGELTCSPASSVISLCVAVSLMIFLSTYFLARKVQKCICALNGT